MIQCEQIMKALCFNQRHKHKRPHVIPLTWNVQKKQMYKDRMLIRRGQEMGRRRDFRMANFRMANSLWKMV